MDGHKIEWYFPEETGASDRYVDEFADSKFNINRWVSFVREVIQNSLDVYDFSLSPRKPVLVKMEYGLFDKKTIPGCNDLYTFIKHAMDGAVEKKSNRQTINRYKKGLEILSNEKIGCFKVSDYNTIGVRSGRDAEWGALVYDEGRSVKNRPGSAGSHGVGKKAPFIISCVNTVLYSTFNKAGDRLFEGKTSLINWDDDNGITRNGKGWFGVINPDPNADRREKILPVVGDEINQFNPFFIRKDEIGTDVIIIGVSIEDFDELKAKAINSILENFFVAIKNSCLEVDVFGEFIDKNNISDYIEKYYVTTKKNFKKIEGLERNVFGNLLNYYKAYDTEPIVFDVLHNDKRYGRCKVFLLVENDKNRKYYCIFRNHGMKIQDVELASAEQPFSAVVFIDDCPEDNLDEKDRLNARLSDVENAAHDDFVVDDEEFECDPTTKVLVESIYQKVKDIILEKTKIEALDETPLEGLEDMLSIQGFLTTRLTPKKAANIKKKKSKIKKKSTGKKADDFEEGVTNAGGKKRKNRVGEGENKPAKEGKDFKATLFTKYETEPLFIKNGDGYDLLLKPDEAAKVDIHISPISVEGSLNYIPNLVAFAECEGQHLLVEDNVIKNVPLTPGDNVVKVKIRNNYNYALECDLYVGGESDD